MASKNYNCIVIKIGSSTLTNPRGKLDLENLARLVAEAAGLVKLKKKIILVTSGAIAAGAEKLGLGKPRTIPQKQAAAAVGQARLMRQYEKCFEAFHLPVAQILLTRDSISDRDRRLNTRHCIATLLNEGVIPIVNENDTVAVEEIKIGDNDNLAALTASLIGADLLAILTDVDGFYMKNEAGIPSLVPEIKAISRKVREAAGKPSTRLGTGGMISKIQAAEICFAAGIDLLILNGRKAGLIRAALSGARVGTIFRAGAPGQARRPAL